MVEEIIELNTPSNFYGLIGRIRQITNSRNDPLFVFDNGYIYAWTPRQDHPLLSTRNRKEPEWFDYKPVAAFSPENKSLRLLGTEEAALGNYHSEIRREIDYYRF
jgi:hypothetical protein